MKKFIIAIIAMTLSTSALADSNKISGAFMADAMAYVASETSINTMSNNLAKYMKREGITFDNMSVPNIIFMEQQELNKHFLKDRVDEALIAIVKNLLAVYDDDPESPTYGSIYLLDTWDESNIFDRETFIHEMVHHAQEHANVASMKSCGTKLEDAAYKIGLAYLIDNGVTDKKTIEARKWQAFMFSKCITDRHN